jgi:short subunit dehydrogenase-like uncharacterized protein
MKSPEIIVVGAGGLVGQRVVGELVREKASVALAARRPAMLAAYLDAPVHEVDVHDAASLVTAFAGAKVVINCTAPLRETAAPVLVAAARAGAHYVDVGGEQAALHALYEQHESTARRAGRVALPGAGVDCLLGDLAAAWAAAHLVGEAGDAEAGDAEAGDAVRAAPAPRLAEDRPLDEITVTYVLDDLAASPGLQRAWLGAAFSRALVWRRDRW